MKAKSQVDELAYQNPVAGLDSKLAGLDDKLKKLNGDLSMQASPFGLVGGLDEKLRKMNENLAKNDAK